MVVRLAETLHTDPNALLYPPQPRTAALPGRPVAYKSIFITLLLFFLAMTVFGGVFGVLLEPIIGGGVQESYTCIRFTVESCCWRL